MKTILKLIDDFVQIVNTMKFIHMSNKMSFNVLLNGKKVHQ